MKQLSDIKKVRDYSLQKVIGKGSFATVYLATLIHDNHQYAVKEMEIPIVDDGRMELFEREVDILKRVDHPSIIKMHDMFQTDQYLYLVFDYCKNGDLEKFLRQNQPTGRVGIPELKARSIFVQVVGALLELKRLNIVHRDLKLANILVTEHHEVKLADFGFAKFMSHENTLLESYCGTPLTMAPEILRNDDKYTSKCDMWSLGVILYQVVFGTAPFKPKPGGGVPELLQVIETQQLKFPPYVEASDHLKSLISSLLMKDPQTRYGIDQIIKHPWVSDSFKNQEDTLNQSQVYLRRISSETYNEVLESREIFHDAQESVYNNDLTQEVGVKISMMLQELRKCLIQVKTTLKDSISINLENKINSVLSHQFKLSLKFQNSLKSLEILSDFSKSLDVILFNICIDIYQVYLKGQEISCLQCLKALTLFINNQQGLVSSEITFYDIDPSVLNVYVIAQTIQNHSQFKESALKMTQLFRYHQDDWPLLQQLILDQMTRNNIYI